MSNSLHNIAMGLDLNLQQFTQELQRAQNVFSKWAQANTKDADAMAAEFERQVKTIMEAAGVMNSADPMGGGLSTQAKADQIALVRQLESIQDEETDVALRARMMGATLNDAFEDGSMGALTFEQRMESINSGCTQFIGRASAMGAAGRTAFSQMNQEAGKTNIIVSQLGYGIEDFFTVYEYMGASGAFRAASNNFAMLARTLFSSAIMGNVVAIGLALGPTLIKYLQGSTEEAEKFVDVIDKAVDELSHIQKLKESALDAKFRLQDIVGSADEKIRLAFAWDNPEIKPTVDSSELVAAVKDMQDKIKSLVRDSQKDALSLEGERDAQAMRTDMLLTKALAIDAAAELREQTKRFIDDGWAKSSGEMYVAQVEAAQEMLRTRLRESPESAEGALRSFKAEMDRISEAVEAERFRQNNYNSDFGLGRIEVLDEVSDRVQALLDDEESMAEFLRQQKMHSQEIESATQKLAATEQERLATLHEQQKLQAAAAEKRRQELLEKQREAQEGLMEKAASKDKTALKEVYDAQMEILKLRREALGENPGALLTQQVNAAAGAAMQNLLQDAAKKFGGDVKEEIDRLKETFITQRTTQDAQRAVLTTVLAQRQEATKKERENTEILQAIRDALQNNALVMVPVH